MKTITESSCSCQNCELKTLFFGHLKDETISFICNTKREQIYSKGEIILEEGQEINDFLYLKEGLVKLSRKTTDFSDQILSFARPLDFVSILSLFSSQVYNYSVTALDDVTTCILPLSEIKDIVIKNGRFAINLIQKMNIATDRIILENLEIKRKHLRGRIAHVLLYFSSYIYQKAEFELPVSRREIAEYIGMTTENVIRTLSEFRKDKIIKIYGKLIEIVDYDRLKNISEHG